MTGHVTTSATTPAGELPAWVALVRASNPGPMTLDGTNTWILRAPGHDACVVVDPGPDDDEHLAAIRSYGPIDGVLVTHGHPDHVEAVPGLGLPVLAVDGEATLAGLRVERLATPGHTGDSVCFVVEGEAVLTGDTILGRGTTVVAHPDGNLGEYLASLRALSAYTGKVALPGHGPALADCGAAASFYLAHREARIDQVRAAVADGARTAREVVETVYADVDRDLWWAADLTVTAALEYLAGVPPLDRP